MNYKIVRIAKYVKKGKESIVSIPYLEFKELVENDKDLKWYEDVDEGFKKRQAKRKTPALKKSATYNFKPLPETPDFRATFISFTDDIIVRIYGNYNESILKLKEMAEKLDAKLYE